MIKKTIKKIPADVFQNAQLKLNELVKMFEPYLVVLTPEERQTLTKNGTGSFEFVKLSHELAVEYPELFPSFIKTAIFREEFFTAHELFIFARKIEQLKNNLNDTEMLAGSRALDVAMTFYQTVKIAARRDIPGARTIFEELKPAFPYRSRKRKKRKSAEPDGQLELFESLSS